MRALNPKRVTLPIIRNLSVCVSLGLASFASQALTLGNVRGSVWVGRTVNVIVPIQLDAGDHASDVCTEIEISFADNRLDSGKVRSGWQSPDATGEGLLRIQSTIGVDEPVVSFLVRAGCTRKTERRYVLLADMPDEVTRSTVTALPAIASGSGSLAAPSSPKKNLNSSVKSKAERSLLDASVSAAKPTMPSAAPEPAAVKERSSKKAVAAPKHTAPDVVAPPLNTSPLIKPRLKLEPLPEGNAGLKSSLELVTLPTEDEQARGDARALWRSLNAQPADLIVEKQRLQAMENQVKALQSSTTQSKAEQEALKAKLIKAEEDQYSNAVVGVLSALLLCALAGAGYLWVRMRRLRFGSDKDWWHGHSAEPSILSEIATHKESTRPAPRGKDSRSSKLSRHSQADLGVDESMFDSLINQTSIPSRKSARHAAAADSISPRSGFQNSMMGSRSVNVEELFDIQQQAEFFVSLGQHDQAIELLRQHIYGASSTSGLAYLDLLQLYHKFSRRQEYDQLRAEFNQSFNAHVPPFDQFGYQNRGIERYPNAISRITQGWKTPEIANILQDCIFRKPDAGDSETFDLEAYRELLLLFAIANEVVEPKDIDTSESNSSAVLLRSKDGTELNLNVAPFASSRLPTLSTTAADTLNTNSVQKNVTASVDSRVDSGEAAHLSLPKPSPRLGLDVDLFELESVMSPLDPVPDLAPLDFTLSGPTPLAEPAPKAPAPKAPTASSPLSLAKVEPSLELDISNYLADSTTMPLTSSDRKKV